MTNNKKSILTISRRMVKMKMEVMMMMKMLMMMMMIVVKLEGYCAGQMDLLLSSPHLYANEQSFLPLIVIIVNIISAAAAASTSKQPKIPSLTKI